MSLYLSSTGNVIYAVKKTFIRSAVEEEINTINLSWGILVRNGTKAKLSIFCDGKMKFWESCSYETLYLTFNLPRI